MSSLQHVPKYDASRPQSVNLTTDYDHAAKCRLSCERVLLHCLDFTPEKNLCRRLGDLVHILPWLHKISVALLFSRSLGDYFDEDLTRTIYMTTTEMASAPFSRLPNFYTAYSRCYIDYFNDFASEILTNDLTTSLHPKNGLLCPS